MLLNSLKINELSDLIKSSNLLLELRPTSSHKVGRYQTYLKKLFSRKIVLLMKKNVWKMLQLKYFLILLLINSQAPESSRGACARFARSGTNVEAEV